MPSRSKKRPPPSRRGGRGGRGSYVPQRGRQNFIALDSSADQGGFTLADEARHTSQHDHSSWMQASNLRHRTVAFVSAGLSEPLKSLDKLLDDETKSYRSSSTDPAATKPKMHQQNGPSLPESGIIVDQSDAIEVPGSDPDHHSQAPTEDPGSFFVIDVVGTQVQQRPQSQLAKVLIPDRPSSPESSSSEVILFRGRDHRLQKTFTGEMVAAEKATQTLHLQTRVAEESTISTPSTTWSLHDPKSKKRGPKRPHRVANSSFNDHDDEEAAILADYIANIRENGGSSEILSEESDEEDQDDGGKSAARTKNDGNNLTSETQNAGTNVPCKQDADLNDDDDDDDDDDNDDDGSESDLDDEKLARAFARHVLGVDDDVNFGDSSSELDNDRPSHQAGDEEFDFMDWHRPSLRRKKGKGAKAQVNFNVSDSELEQALQQAWKTDRMKKAERKKQREQLRALGMLGKKANPEDLRTKYPDGMSMDQIATEMQTFLLGCDETLALPPMDNHARKVIHDFANIFKIKSKSTGKGDQRRPVLYRTLRTLDYSESTFNQAVKRINRRYFPRLDTKGKRSQRPQPSRSNHADATYRDGEVIGAAAPELGTENRGRAMLEKMGWSSGTALGSSDNKGILQPVTQTMKRSKAGLG